MGEVLRLCLPDYIREIPLKKTTEDERIAVTIEQIIIVVC
jgi:hypothetical protein